MSILAVYSYDLWLEPTDLEDEDDSPVCPPELLTAGWWSASSNLEDEE